MSKVQIRFAAFFATFLLLLSGGIHAAQIQLKNWEFSFDKTNWEEVTVPHSWNALDGHSRNYFRGEAFYRTTIRCDNPSLPSFLRFEGAAQEAEVFVNGQSLAYHKGGYTPFSVPLAGVLHAGDNLVEVICDNSESMDRIPVISDFNKNGGLHNPVSLFVLPVVYMDPGAYGFDRFHFVQHLVNAKRALCEVKTLLCNSSGKSSDINVRITIKDASGTVVSKASVKVTLAAGASAQVSRTLRIKNPHLWNGKKDPYLYTVLVEAGEDVAQCRTGLRSFELSREKGFFLNGESYPLRGVSMHQDTEGKASALSKEDIDRDYGFVKEIGCNFLRLAHYPHNNYAFHLCDSLGIIVQTEIPWVNVCGERAGEAYFENIREQLKEMITALYNHPSIVFWGLWNELDSWGNKESLQGPLDTRKVVDKTAWLYKYARELDHARLIGFTDDSKFRRPNYKELKADFYSQNCYYGWYYNRNDFSGLTPIMYWIKDTMGPVNLSEYGVGVNPFCHTWKSDDVKRYRDDAYHPEEFGNRFHESHLQQICTMPFIGFTSIWVFFDFPVADRHEGYMDCSDGVHYSENPDRLYINDKGLVTRDRKVRKDAFYLYKAYWNREETTVHICSRRLEKRPVGKAYDLWVYSNAASLKVYQNGVEIKSADSTDEITGVIWKFDWMQMPDGPVTIKVVADDGTSDEVTFRPL